MTGPFTATDHGHLNFQQIHKQVTSLLLMNMIKINGIYIVKTG